MPEFDAQTLDVPAMAEALFMGIITLLLKREAQRIPSVPLNL